MTREPPAAAWPDRPHPLDAPGTAAASPLLEVASAAVPIGAAATDVVSNLTCTVTSLRFYYVLSQAPYYQWWALYNSPMRDYAYWGKYETWDWFYNNSQLDKSGWVSLNYNFTAGVIYTLAMYNDPKKSVYQLSDYIEFRAS